MSIIPKIKVGISGKKREKHNLSFDNSTSSNIGNVQPTMCREMVPGSTFKCKVSSLVRLASMPTPTFGRISLRHYHTFIPLIDLWQPFDAMLSGQHYSSGSDTWIPTGVPTFRFNSITSLITQYSDISIAPQSNLNKPYTVTSSNIDYDGNEYRYGSGETYADYASAQRAAMEHDLELLQTAWNAIRIRGAFDGAISSANWFGSSAGSMDSDDKGVILAGNFFAQVKNSTSTLSMAFTDSTSDANVFPLTGGTAINPEGADLITLVNGYYILIKFKAPIKRLRTILIGLGYQFSPYNEETFSVLKLIAYYKAWFNLFCPKRERAFVDTNCYKLIKRLSESNALNASSISLFDDFLKDLMFDCYYYLPMDYFSMSVVKPAGGNQDMDQVFNTGYQQTLTGTFPNSEQVTVQSDAEPQQSPITFGSTTVTNPMVMRLANKLLTWTSKNTVIGRSIREYLKVNFGIEDVNAIDDGGIYRIGSSRVNVKISDIMSTAESSQGYLGEYGGRGIGYSDSDTVDFTADKFGYWITLTTVVPESGYYQGYLKENRHLNRYDFFHDAFDALGYQVLERGEVMDDYNCDGPAFAPAHDYQRSSAFGFVPRYSEYKVGRNIVNGDLSLAGLYNSMSPYTLDRRISAGAIANTALNLTTGEISKEIVTPSFMPSVVYDNFRRIDPTDHLGQYNRIFNYGGNDLDHFIIHNIFEVVAYAPMKSLSESFDTTFDDENEKTIDITHA